MENKRVRFGAGALFVLVTSYLVIRTWVIWGFLCQLLAFLALPFALALLANDLLRPAVEVLVRRRMPVSMAILLLYVIIGLALFVFVYNISDPLSNQWSHFVTALPALITSVQDLIAGWIDMRSAFPQPLQQGLTLLDQKLRQGINSQLASWTDGMGGFLKQAAALISVPFITFYFLKDGEQLLHALLRPIAAPQRDRILDGLRAANTALAGWLRGQLLTSVVSGSLTAIGLSIVGVPFAAILGILLAMFDILPYVGPILAAVFGVIVGLSVSMWTAIKAAAIYFIVQQIEGLLIAPLLVGRSTRVHPMVMMGVLLAAGAVDGVAGLIVAVPIAVILSHLLRLHTQERRLNHHREATGDSFDSTKQSSV
ncbi:MAG: AI-2E family transporter [Firmicutes bacterium]|nr:AI-2E family transporter [Bacillota bacterium]